MIFTRWPRSGSTGYGPAGGFNVIQPVQYQSNLPIPYRGSRRAIPAPDFSSTTWDPAAKNSTLVLSNNNLTVTETTIAANIAVRSTTSRNAASGSLPVAFEVTTVSSQPSFGIADDSINLDVVDNVGNGFFVYQIGAQVRVFSAVSSSDAAINTGTITVGDVWTIIIDIANSKLYVKQNNVDKFGVFSTLTSGITIPSGVNWSVFWKTQGASVCASTLACSSLVYLPAGARAWDDTTSSASPFIFPRNRHYVRR